MKILLLGVFNHGSTDVHKVMALRRATHEVVTFPYRERDVRELGAQGGPFDLLIVSKGVPMKPEGWDHLATLSRERLIYWPDPYENWTDDCHRAVLGFGASGENRFRVVATSLCVLAKIRAHRLKGESAGRLQGWSWTRGSDPQARVIIEGADCTGYLPDPFPEPKPALLHFGHLSDRRREIIETLRGGGVEVNHLEEPAFGAALQHEVLAHAAVLGINSSPDLFSNRVQTVLAMGGAMLQEHAPDLPAHLGLWSWVDDGSGYLAEIAQRRIASPFREREWAERAYTEWSWDRWAEEIVA